MTSAGRWVDPAPSHRQGDADAAARRRIDAARPLLHGRPVGPLYPGSAFAEVAGVPCAALPVPYAWGAQACLSAVADDELVDVARQVAAWLADHASAGWRLEVQAERADGLARMVGLHRLSDHEVWLSATEPPAVDAELLPPVDEQEFLDLFGPELVPMISGQLDRPDWEVGVLRDDDGVAVGCARVIDLADTSYLGGVTVAARRRGEGWGRRLSALTTRHARRRADLVWLYCEAELGPLYASVGYRRVGAAAYLGPPT